MFTVTDANLTNVTDNGTKLEAENGTYSVTREGKHTIVATDAANHETTVTITIHAQHTPEADDGDCTTPIHCKYCDEILVAAKTHVFSDKWSGDEHGHRHECINENCTAHDQVSAHHGGKADCHTLAICDECGMSYGAFDKTNQTGGIIVKHAIAATAGAAGYSGDTYCLGCGELLQSGKVIPALKEDDPERPVVPNYVNQIDNYNHQVSAIGRFPYDASLIVERLTIDKKAEIIADIHDKSIESNYRFERIYDVYMLLNGAVYAPEGSITIKIKLEENLKTKRNLAVAYISDNGEITLIPSTITDGDISFKTDHNSYYAILSQDNLIVNTAAQPTAVIDALWFFFLGASVLLAYKKRRLFIEE